MYCIYVDEECVYACSDWNRYLNQVAKNYVNVANAHLKMSDGADIRLR